MAISSKGETATFKLSSNMGRGDLNIRQILILDLQLQVWSLEAQTSTILFAGGTLGNADVGILNRNCKSEHHKPLLKHL